MAPRARAVGPIGPSLGWGGSSPQTARLGAAPGGWGAGQEGFLGELFPKGHRFRLRLRGGSWDPRRLKTHSLSNQALPGNPAQKDAGLPVNQRSFWATGEAKGGRESRTDGKCISKEAQEFAAQEIISGKVQWGIVWNLKYSQFKRKEGLCSRGVRAGEASGAGWGGARAGRVSGEAGDQAGAELRVRTLTHPACVELQGPRPWAGTSVFGEPHPPPPPLAYWGTPSRLAAHVSLRSKQPAHPTET